ncbi:hypothetical protein GCM10010967_14310 [Dyadobacter beijingensis]|uniref:Uncharacterized protein n=1 Tax=Dyadobacter beijingensis TaxID=365489 RepID=A0ABQ2HLB9_9BACT|nr:hypothetical protein [Dyadobacter beijingensis]GGM83652.1 hypothetical protein GCM10010967_14310 [Dyadobacter beijingensis]
MKEALKNIEEEDIWDKSWADDRDPVGPMMHWEGERSEEDRRFMSEWAWRQREIRAREKAYSESKSE